jgi:hypothetical protein
VPPTGQGNITASPSLSSHCLKFATTFALFSKCADRNPADTRTETKSILGVDINAIGRNLSSSFTERINRPRWNRNDSQVFILIIAHKIGYDTDRRARLAFGAVDGVTSDGVAVTGGEWLVTGNEWADFECWILDFGWNSAFSI